MCSRLIDLLPGDLLLSVGSGRKWCYVVAGVSEPFVRRVAHALGTPCQSRQNADLLGRRPLELATRDSSYRGGNRRGRGTSKAG